MNLHPPITKGDAHQIDAGNADLAGKGSDPASLGSVHGVDWIP